MEENNRTFLHVLSLSSRHTLTYFNPTANWKENYNILDTSCGLPQVTLNSDNGWSSWMEISTPSTPLSEALPKRTAGAS